MTDFISRQAAIDAVNELTKWYWETYHEKRPTTVAVIDRLMELPSAQPEQTKMIKEIREWINSGNRGSADYFIVDKIEEIINKYE